MGDQKFLTLTKSNIDYLSSGFPVSMLKKTFKDAIKVADFLNLRYLWIYSLWYVSSETLYGYCLDEA